MYKPFYNIFWCDNISKYLSFILGRDFAPPQNYNLQVYW